MRLSPPWWCLNFSCRLQLLVYLLSGVMRLQLLVYLLQLLVYLLGGVMRLQLGGVMRLQLLVYLLSGVDFNFSCTSLVV